MFLVEESSVNSLESSPEIKEGDLNSEFSEVEPRIKLQPDKSNDKKVKT